MDTHSFAPAEIDTYVFLALPTSPYSADTILAIGTDIDKSDYVRRTLLYFDLDTIPRHSHVMSACVVMHKAAAGSVSSGFMNILRCESFGGNATWNTQPPTSTYMVESFNAPVTSTKTVTICGTGLRSQVQYAIRNNVGENQRVNMLIRAVTEGSSDDYWSAPSYESGSPGLAPALWVTYRRRRTLVGDLSPHLLPPWLSVPTAALGWIVWRRMDNMVQVKANGGKVVFQGTREEYEKWRREH